VTLVDVLRIRSQEDFHETPLNPPRCLTAMPIFGSGIAVAGEIGWPHGNLEAQVR